MFKHFFHHFTIICIRGFMSLYFKGVNMAFIKRYSTIRKGGINFIGNTLGLSKITNVNRGGL